MVQALTRKVTSGHQILVYVMFSVIVITFLLLTDIETDAPFKGNLIFFLMLLGSFFFLFAVSFTPIFERKLGGEHSARLFFFTDVSLGKFIIWIPVGVLGSFGIALISQNLGLDSTFASLISIAGSGTVMMIIFFVTKTIMIPIIIHGTFNVIVIALRDGILQSVGVVQELFPIPDVGITTFQFNQFATDVLIQYTLVAPAEEMLKMLVIAFVVLGIPSARFKDGIAKYIGAFFALLIWSSFHAIQAV